MIIDSFKNNLQVDSWYSILLGKTHIGYNTRLVVVQTMMSKETIKDRDNYQVDS